MGIFYIYLHIASLKTVSLIVGKQTLEYLKCLKYIKIIFFIQHKANLINICESEILADISRHTSILNIMIIEASHSERKILYGSF